MNSLFDNLRFLQVLPTTDLGTGNTTSDWVDFGTITRGMFVLETSGAIADDIDVFKLQQATSNAGAGAKDITGATIATFPTSPADGYHLILELDARALDKDNGFEFAAAVASSDGAGASNVSIAFVAVPRFKHQLLNLTVSTDAVKTP